MRLILTLLCRNEIDIIESMIRFHLGQGVDCIVATDNGSTDGTRECLQRYVQSGHLLLIDQHESIHDQSVWVSAMARMATEQLAADWLIHSDADEFWWPLDGDLKSTLLDVPADVLALTVGRSNFLPPPRDSLSESPELRCFHQRQLIRERRSLNSLGQPLPGKICHRALPGLSISDGNHGVALAGQAIAAPATTALEILHFPVRSLEQFNAKISHGAQALARNPRLPVQVGATWRQIYNEHVLGGTMESYYDGLCLSPLDRMRGLAEGSLLHDLRLHHWLAGGDRVAALPDPSGSPSHPSLKPMSLPPPGSNSAAAPFQPSAISNPDQPIVAVITPYFDEPLELLWQCHQSVLAQEYPCIHVLVADGRPKADLDDWQAHHVVLPKSHGDIGSTPRLIGSYHAIGLGVEAVAFLDADNWYHPGHINGLMRLRAESGAAFMSSSRMLCRLDGGVMGPCPLIDSERFIDTNCMLFAKEAFPLLHHWVLMPDYGHLVGDRIMFHHVRCSGVSRQHLNEPSVFYRCGKPGLYRQMGEEPPTGIPDRPEYEASFQRWLADGYPPL